MASADIRTAFILAGGKGVRMRRLGQYLPKCTLVIYDQPLLIRQIESCRKAGVAEVLISVSEQYEELVRSIVRPLAPTVHIDLLVDRTLAGPVHALLSSADRLRGKHHFFLLSDIYSEGDEFFQDARRMDPHHLILNTQIQPDADLISSGCNVVAEGKRISKILEKPKKEEVQGRLAWTGLSVHPASFFNAVESATRSRPVGSFSHIGELYQELVNAGLGALSCPTMGSVVNVTTPDDLLIVNALEFRKIRNLRPDEKRRTWEMLRDLIK